MKILDGKVLAKKIREELGQEILKIGIKPNFKAILIGNNPASRVYVGMKEKACSEIGILHERLELPQSTTQEQVLSKIKQLNEDNSVTGIMVQLPLPDHIYAPEIIKAIEPKKDVDGFTAYNLGKVFLSSEFEQLPPATPAGIVRLLDEYKIDVKGMNAVVIGSSNIVGKPISTMFLNRNATVTTCHIYTKDLAFYTKNADIIVIAAGVINLLKPEMVKNGVIVIDVGINKNSEGKIVGDVDFTGVSPKCSFITPVPGGVGPMTVAQLMINIINAAKRIQSAD